MQTRITLLNVLVQAHKAYEGMEKARMFAWNNKAPVFQAVIDKHQQEYMSLREGIEGLKYDGALFTEGTKSRNIIDILFKVLQVLDNPEDIARVTEEINALQTAFPLSSSESWLSVSSWTKPQYLTDYEEFVKMAKEYNTQTLTRSRNELISVAQVTTLAVEEDKNRILIEAARSEQSLKDQLHQQAKQILQLVQLEQERKEEKEKAFAETSMTTAQLMSQLMELGKGGLSYFQNSSETPIVTHFPPKSELRIDTGASNTTQIYFRKIPSNGQPRDPRISSLIKNIQKINPNECKEEDFDAPSFYNRM